MNLGMMYGEDIGALVVDIGSYSMRGGYAQEDSPKADIPAVVGVVESLTEGQVGNNVTKSFKYHVHTSELCAAKNDMNVVSYMKDGMIEDWDIFEKVLEYMYSKCLHMESKYNPVLMTETPSNTRAKREKLTEIMFEKYNVPAFFLIKNAVTSAFANGRITCVVVDSGASHTSAIPIHDGYVLTHATVKSPLGGDFISNQCAQFLQERNIEVIPSYMVASKESTKDKERPIWTKKRNIPRVTRSWHDYMVKRVIQDFQQSVLQISESPYDDKTVSALPTMHYEFPNGYNQDFGPERFKIPESLFDPSATLGGSMLGIGHLITTSVGMCDGDIRPALYNNIVLTGGNSLIQGFSERLTRDLSMRIPPSMRLKVIAASSSSERRFASWIGGSILASIGTFQQMWISSQEYDEYGNSQLERKCP